MFITFKRLFLTLSINSCLFIILIIGIQNSSNKSKVDLLIDETVYLPVGFIIGTSFISGSLIGSFLPIIFDHKKNKNS